MSRWFRHYAGMMRDEKLVAVAIRSKQPVERVMWVWGAILESAAEIEDAGRYELDAAEAAYFLRADEADICAVLTALANAGRVADGAVVKWGDRQYLSDKSSERQARYRERMRSKDRHGDAQEEQSDVTPPSPQRHVTPQETETEEETDKKDNKAIALSSAKPDLAEAMVEIYHEIGAGIWPMVSKITAARRSHANRRAKDCGGLDGWRNAMIRARDAPHLVGSNDRGWVASFDFFMQEQSFRKLLEGCYDVRRNSGNPQRQHRPASGHDNILTALDELVGAGHRRDERPADHASVDDAYRDTAGVYRLTN